MEYRPQQRHAAGAVEGADTSAATRARAERLLDVMGLTDFGRKYPFELSGGMQQRVSICRALMRDPRSC